MKILVASTFLTVFVSLTACQTTGTSRTSYPTTATPLARSVAVTRHEDITRLVKASLSEDQSLYGFMAIRFHTDQPVKSVPRAPEPHVDMIIPMAREGGAFVPRPKNGTVFYLAGDDKTPHRQKHRLYDMKRNVERYFRSSPAAFVVRPWDGAIAYWGQTAEVEQMAAVFEYVSELWGQPIDLAGHSNGGSLAVALAQQLGSKIGHVMVTAASLDKGCHLSNFSDVPVRIATTAYDPSANIALFAKSTKIVVLHDPADEQVSNNCAQPVAAQAAKLGMSVEFRNIEIRNDDNHHSNGPVNLGYEWGRWRS